MNLADIMLTKTSKREVDKDCTISLISESEKRIELIERVKW